MISNFDYDNINLVPRYSVVDSRSECDTSIQFGPHKFKNPVIPANMESVIDENLAIELSKNGYFYVMHRFNIDIKTFVINMKKLNLISSISIGVNDDSYMLLNDLIENNLIPDYITIDIAHGHCKKMKKMLKFIKDKKINSFIIAGNVSSIEATVDLDNWGADAIKVGIGPGCFVGCSKVLTNKGYVNMENVKINDKVLTHNNNFEKVIATTSYLEEDDLIKINRNISTKNHKYYVINKKYKDIVNIKNYKNYANWVEAIYLNKDEHLLLEFKNKKFIINYCKKINTVEIKSIDIIKNESSQKMYDLTVNEQHSYTVNDIVVHNSACTTFPTTGFGSRNIQASVVNKCAGVTKKPIIADGGIKYPADITKSIVLGASMIMIGGMMSAFIDSPGRVVEIDGTKFKEFYGSASSRQGQKTNRIEGTVKLNKLKTVTSIEYLDYLTECLQSSISYGGGKKLSDLYSVRWIQN